MKNSKFDTYLQSKSPIILDGGLATQLEAQDFILDGALWSARLLPAYPCRL
ncbi:hypothetical protein [Microbulbifer agarilyticus]